MLRVKRGDDGAFAQLVRRYEAPLYNYLKRMTGNASDAQDLFQETFLRVHRHARRFKEGRPFKPWLYRIATNLSIDFVRKRARHGVVRLETDERAGAERADPKTTAANPRAAAIGVETAERLSAAIAELPSKHRAVFLMARYDGLSYGDIADALGIPVGTVKSRMNKAVRQLMSALAGCGR